MHMMAPLLKTSPLRRQSCVAFLAALALLLLPSAAGADSSDSSCPAGLQPELVAGGSSKQHGKPSMLLQRASPAISSGPVGEEDEDEEQKPAPTLAAETDTLAQQERKPASTVAAETGTVAPQEQQAEPTSTPAEQAKASTAEETQTDLTRTLFSLDDLSKRVSRLTGPAAAFLWKPIPLWGGAESDPSLFAVPVAVVASVFFSFIIAACIVVRYHPKRSKLDMQFEQLRFGQVYQRSGKSMRSNCW